MAEKQVEKLIDDDTICTCKVAGNVIEITRLSSMNLSPVMRKLDAEHMVDIRDGSVVEIDHSEKRTDNIRILKRSLADLRDLINTNVTDAKNVRWVTLTYKENMQDTERLTNDFKKLLLRLHRKYGTFEYVSCPEPQARGAWHLHLLLIFPDTAPFIPNADLAQMWGQGFVKIVEVDNVDNVGAYLSAYMSDIYLDADGSSSDAPSSDGKSKKQIKGGRLYMYPAGMQICRHSRGLKKPDIIKGVSAGDIRKEYVRGGSLTYSYTYSILTDDGKTIEITREYYNTRRKA